MLIIMIINIDNNKNNDNGNNNNSNNNGAEDRIIILREFRDVVFEDVVFDSNSSVALY